MKWATRFLVVLVCLVEIQYMIIDYRLRANLQLLQSALHEISLLSDSEPLPNTPTNLRSSGGSSFSEELLTVVVRKNSSLRRPTPQSLN
jgi:hypothetical protein